MTAIDHDQSTTARDDTVMRSLRINYHAEDKSALLHDCLLPLARQAGSRPGITSAWVQSHWRFGPHLSLYAHGLPSAIDQLLADTEHQVRVHLHTHPSGASVTDEQWDTASRELGRLELVEPPYVPVRADNTVERHEGGPRDTFLRTERAVQVKGRVLNAGLGCLLDEQGSPLQGQAAADATFRGMAALAASYPRWGLVSGYQAFLSHWKEYFYWADEGGRLTEPLTRAWQAQQPELDRVVRLAHDRRAGRPTGDAVLDRWFDWVDSQFPTVDALAVTGDILPYPHPSRLEQAGRFGDATRIQWSGSDERTYSDFHTAFRQLDFTQLGNGTDFAAYRFLINNFFELLPLMGVTPMQRYALAFLVTESAQSVLGERWEETIAKAVARQRAAGDALTPTLPWRGEHV